MKTNWVALSATTSSGKSTMARALAQHGLPIVPDLNRIYLDARLAQGKTIAELRANPQSLFEGMFALREKVERALLPWAAVPMLLDRCLPEFLAYAKVDGLDLSKFALPHDAPRYQAVLLLAPLDFEADGLRQANPARRLAVQKSLLTTWKKLGYQPIEVSVLAEKERASWGWRKIQSQLPELNPSAVAAMEQKINEVISAALSQILA